MIKNIKIKDSKFIKNRNVNVFFGFLLIAFAFLILTKLSKSYTEEIEFDINFSNVPDEQIIIKDENSKIKILVKSLGFNLFSYSLKDKSINLDLDKDLIKSHGSYLWTSSKGKIKIESELGDAFKVLSIYPDSLFFLYETMSSKKVPVKLNSDVNYASGFDVLNELKITPDSIKIIGSESALSKISSINTEPLVIKNVKKNIDLTLQLNGLDSINNITFSQNKVSVFGKVEKFTEGIVEVSVKIKNLPNKISINYFPKLVTVSYYINLKDYETINASDFVVECDYLEIENSNKTSLTPVLTKVPNRVKTARIKQNKIEFIIEQ